MGSTADQIVETLSGADPARLARGEAQPASPQPSPVVRIEKPGPHRAWFGEPEASDERERRKDDPEQTQLQLSLEEGDGHQANVQNEQPVGDRPPESVSSRVGAERECRQARKREEGDARQAGVDRETAFSRPVDVVEVKEHRDSSRTSAAPAPKAAARNATQNSRGSNARARPPATRLSTTPGTRW